MVLGTTSNGERSWTKGPNNPASRSSSASVKPVPTRPAKRSSWLSSSSTPTSRAPMRSCRRPSPGSQPPMISSWRLVFLTLRQAPVRRPGS